MEATLGKELDGSPLCRCAMSDISARMRAEQLRRESENRFRSMFLNAPMPYQSLDEQGNFLDVNHALSQALGYSREELIGKNFGDFLHPDWVDHFKENFPRFKAVGEILGVEFEMVKKDGAAGYDGFEYLSEALGATRRASELGQLMRAYLGQTVVQRTPQNFSKICREFLAELKGELAPNMVLDTRLHCSVRSHHAGHERLADA